MLFRPALRALDVRVSAIGVTRHLTVATTAVLLLGLGAASAGSGAHSAAVEQPMPTSAFAVEPQIVVPTLRTPAPKLRVVGRKAKRALPVRPHADAPTAPRYLPSGTGMWIHDWSATENGHAPEVVARAQAAGLTHLYVQTGSSKKGWIGQPVLSQLLPATKGTDLKVIAWDFPKLLNPEDDARRLVKAAWWRRPGVPMIAAVAPDIETLAEGTHATPSTIDRYYRTLRKELPARVAILATVPWPSEKRISRYPYTRTALHADAFVPMAYWYNRSPSVVTAISMRVLKQFGKPVFPVGQGYDGRLDAPYLAQDPTPDKSVDAFVRAARAGGATSLSLWSWQTTGALQWGALVRASSHFAAPVAPPAGSPAKSGRSGWHPGKPVGTG